MIEELRRLLDAYDAWPTEYLPESGMVKQEAARQELMEALFEHRAEIVAALERADEYPDAEINV